MSVSPLQQLGGGHHVNSLDGGFRSSFLVDFHTGLALGGLKDLDHVGGGLAGLHRVQIGGGEHGDGHLPGGHLALDGGVTGVIGGLVHRDHAGERGLYLAVALLSLLLGADAGVRLLDVHQVHDHAGAQGLSQLGPQLAEALGTGVIVDLVDIEQTDAGICAKQETEEGYRKVESALPCVVTVNKPAYDPRYPTIKSKMAARKMAIPVLSAADLDSVEPGKPTAHVVKVFEPAKRQAGVKINEETAAESAIKAVDMMAAAKLL